MIIRSIGTNAIQYTLVLRGVGISNWYYITRSITKATVNDHQHKAGVVSLPKRSMKLIALSVLVLGYGILGLVVYILGWWLLLIVAATVVYFFVRSPVHRTSVSGSIVIEENLAGWHTGVGALLPPVPLAKVIPFPTTYSVVQARVPHTSTYRQIGETAC
jgi:hypothetical protein